MSLSIHSDGHRLSCNRTDFRLGNLLISAGAITTDQLRQAQKMARTQGVRLGSLMVHSGMIKPAALASALAADDCIQRKQVESDVAIKALTMAIEKDEAFEGELESLKSGKPTDLSHNKLAELLCRTTLVSHNEARSALDYCSSTGLPFGRVLVVRNLLPDSCLATALALLWKVQKSTISMDEAVLRLSEGEEETLREVAPYLCLRNDSEQPGKAGIDALLGRSGVVSREDLLYALEVRLTSDKPIEQLLLDLGFVSQDLLQAAKVLLERISSSSLEVSQALNCLEYMFEQKTSLEEAISKLKLENRDSEESALHTTADVVCTDRKRSVCAKLDPEAASLFEEMHRVSCSIARDFVHHGMLDEAATLADHIAAITENNKGKQDVLYSDDLANLATILCLQSKFDEALPVMEESVNILENEQSFKIDSSKLAGRINKLADIYIELENYSVAECLLCRALSIRQQCLPHQDPALTYTLNDYGRLLRKTERYAEAEKVFAECGSPAPQQMCVPQFEFEENHTF